MTRAVLNQFASLTNPTLPNLDADFLGVANTLVVPCTATGTNSITLTPVTNTVTVSTYSDKDQYTFNAPATSTGAMTLQVNSLGPLNLYKAGGTTQANAGDVVNGQFYQVAYQASLNASAGGFVIVSAVPPTVATTTSGTFSPTIVGSTAAGSFTYTNQLGQYWNANGLVTVWGRITINAISSSPTGNTLISGLPFQASNFGFSQSATLSRWFSVPLTAGYTQATGEVNSNTNQIQVLQNGSSQVASSVQVTVLGANTDLEFSATYRTG